MVVRQQYSPRYDYRKYSSYIGRGEYFSIRREGLKVPSETHHQNVQHHLGVKTQCKILEKIFGPQHPYHAKLSS